MSEKRIELSTNVDSVYEVIKKILSEARANAYRSVNFAMVRAYWNIGKVIVEEEQKGKERADYGKYLITQLSKKLTRDFGKGFTETNIRYMRQFYNVFPKHHALRDELTWTHYRLLLKIEKQEAINFYMIEAVNNNWSTRELEQALIDHLQTFLLELGKGFAFVARQKRITLDNDHFYIDLVFYNRLARCFVLIDLKVGKMTHQDIGQMQMYLNYYRRTQMVEGENEPIGIVLCAEKNEAVVKFTLPENQKQIFVSKYQLYLPTEAELKQEIMREKELFETEMNLNGK